MKANTKAATANVAEAISSKAKAKAEPKASPKLSAAGQALIDNEVEITRLKDENSAEIKRRSVENMVNGLAYFKEFADTDTGAIERKHKSELTTHMLTAGVKQPTIDRLYQSIAHPKAQQLVQNCATSKAIAERLAEKKIKTQSAMRAYCKEAIKICNDVADYVTRCRAARFVGIAEGQGKIDVLGHIEPSKLDAFYGAMAEKLQEMYDKADA